MPFRTSQLATASFLACVLIWFVSTFRPKAAYEQHNFDIKPNEAQEFHNDQLSGDIWGHHGIVNFTRTDISLARVHLGVSQSELTSSPLLQKLDIALPPSMQVKLGDDNVAPPVSESATASTTIRIPHILRTHPNASEFLFGVATTYERLNESLPAISHWLSGSNSHLIAAMEPAPDTDVPKKVLKRAQDLKIPLGLIDSSYPFLDRYFSLVRELYENRQPTTKWYVLIDDDTFFPDLSNLIRTFQSKYNPEKPYYIGALTEDFQQMATWGYMAYGGGGVFLSHTLVEQILPHWDLCYARRNTGDRMLAECIYKHTSTKFTWEHNLHQLDLHGDQSGFYEALRPQPLSLHHWKSGEFRFSADMYNMSLVSSICGNACLLQKFGFADGWILTNGFSLVKYSDADTRHRDVETDISMERTWEFYYPGSTDVHFEHSLGPIRKPDEKGKISYRMESAFREDGGDVRQLYVKRRRRKEFNDPPGHGEVDSVIEIQWTMA